MIGLSRPVECIKGERRQRYRCRACGRSFCDSTPRLIYRLRHPDPALNAKIFSLSLHGVSNRKIGRLLHISEHSVRIRLERMSQRALEFHHELSMHRQITEPVAFDGLENFSGSQYAPNNIQQAIGRDSLFIYDFNFASLNRKGRMSIWQKERLRQIVEREGRFDPKAIRRATEDIVRRLLGRVGDGGARKMVLLSDEHFQYRRVVERDLLDVERARLEHVTISSKVSRNFQNILFAVNHADLLIRQNTAAFARETISFSKTAGRMCQRYALFMVYKNYMVPMFSKKHVRRPRAHEETPAQAVGVVERRLGFGDIFTKRSLGHRVGQMSEDWQHFWNGEVPQKYHRSLKFA